MFVRGMVPLLIAAILAGITGCNGGSSDGPSLSEQYQQLRRQPNPDIRANKLVSLAIEQNKARNLHAGGGGLGGGGRLWAGSYRPNGPKTPPKPRFPPI